MNGPQAHMRALPAQKCGRSCCRPRLLCAPAGRVCDVRLAVASTRSVKSSIWRTLLRCSAATLTASPVSISVLQSPPMLKKSVGFAAVQLSTSSWIECYVSLSLPASGVPGGPPSLDRHPQQTPRALPQPQLALAHRAAPATAHTPTSTRPSWVSELLWPAPECAVLQ